VHRAAPDKDRTGLDGFVAGPLANIVGINSIAFQNSSSINTTMTSLQDK
jgi:hypothetical protein